MKKNDLPKNSRIEIMVTIKLKGQSLPLTGVSEISHEDGKPISFSDAGDAIQRASYEVMANIWPKDAPAGDKENKDES